MFPNEHMSSYYDPRTGVMNPWANSYGCYPNPMPCCSHGYNNCYYALPPGPATPYTHIYPPQPYVSSPPSPPHYYHRRHQPIPSIPVNSYPPSDGCFPLQHQQQHTAWRPVMVPQSNCCCGFLNQNSCYEGNQINSGHDDSKMIKQQTEESQTEDVTRAGSMKPVAWNNGNNSSQPHLFWIPPQYVNNQQQQNVDKGPQDWNMAGQLIPFHLDKFGALQDKGGNKHMAAGVRNDFPLPFILMPQNTSSSGNSAKDRIKEIEENSSSFNNSKPLKLLVDDDVTVPHESVKTVEPPADTISKGEQLQNQKVRVKDIPVKQAGENNETKPSTNFAIESRSRTVSPTKTSKLPPVCLRVDPLPRKKAGKGTASAKSPSLSGHQRNLQQSVSTSKNKENTVQPTPLNSCKTEDINVTKKDEREEKIHQHSIGQENNVKVLDPKKSPKDNAVASFDEDGNVKQGREIDGEGESVDSVKPSKEGKSLSEEAAAVRIQSAYRGYEERKWQSLQKLRQIAKVREQIFGIKHRIQALETDPEVHKGEIERQRLMIGETIMSLLLTLDTIQGLHSSFRDIRKSVAKELVSLQEKLDSFHGRRSRENEHWMEHGKGDEAKINEVTKDRSRTEKEDVNDTVKASNQDEFKHEEIFRKNMSAHDERVDKEQNMEKSSEKVDVKVENTGDYTCAELCHDVPVDSAHTEQIEGETGSGANDQKQDKLPLIVGDHNEDWQFDEHLEAAARETKDPAPVNGNDPRVNGTDGCNDYDKAVNVGEEVDLKVNTAADEAEGSVTEYTDGCNDYDKAVNVGEEVDLKVNTAADEAEGSVAEYTEVITSGEPPSEACSNWSTASDVSKNEATVNCEVAAPDPRTAETNQMLLEDKQLSQCSCTSTVENGEIVSGEVLHAGETATNSDNESVLEVCGGTFEHVHSHMENQVDCCGLGPSEGNSCEQETTISSICPLAGISPDMEEVVMDELLHVGSDDRQGKAAEKQVCKQTPEFEMVDQDAQNVMTLDESARLSKASREVVEQPADRKLVVTGIDKNSKEFGECINDVESEESLVTDNSSKADKTSSELCDEGLEKSNAAVDDATLTLPGTDGAPYSSQSQASLPSSKAAGDLALAEENQKLREMVRKLLESEKDQLSVISTLNGRLKNLEKKVMKKRKFKVQRSPSNKRWRDDRICT